MRILVVEDEETIADVIATKLRCEKYEVDTAFDGEDGLYSVMSNIYDLIILDIMLPKMNGLEILKKIKENDISAKVIMLTAKTELDDKLKGFDIGADDYVTKPFHIEELIARVNVQLRNIGNSKIKDIKEQIYDKVWGIDTDYESNNLEAYLSFLRKKIKIIGSKVSIKAVRNLGYKMEE